MNSFKLKNLLPDIICIAIFAAISFLYFTSVEGGSVSCPPASGKVLTGVDHSGAIGSGVEMEEYRKTHDGERTRWTNSLFSGMPTYQMAPSYDSTKALSTVEDIYQLGLPDVIAYIFMMLLGFYIMLRAFNFKAWMAALGAVLWAFSSYYFIIIAAGHIWKLLTLCFIPPTIGGMVLCYRGKYLWGIAVTGIFTALQILSNHVQMTYYFLFVIGFIALGYLLQFTMHNSQSTTEAVKTDDKQPSQVKTGLQKWFKATCCFALGGILGVLVNASNLFHTWQYSKETMRSKSELTQKTKEESNQTKSGLERDYITAWSYGGDEMLTLMIPNTKGGASMPLSKNATAMKKADGMLSQYGIYDAFPQYFGEQPGTSGPVYIGAFVCFLFVLGLLIVKGPMKWCLLGATILSVLLSMGHNLMWFTDLFLDYVPMYDKFRTVASILVIAEFTMPLLGLLALKQLVEKPETLKQKHTMLSIYIALGLTAGVCLLLWLCPGIMGSYVSSSDISGLDQYVARGYMDRSMADSILASIGTMRKAMFTADAIRSFFIIMAGFAALMIFRAGKLKAWIMVIILTVICLFDMWTVNKRYLNNDMFTTPRPATQMFPKTQADEAILQDPSLYYRVLNRTVDTWNDNTTSCYHKSIGGYHAAKLRRYQELIEAHLAAEGNVIQNAAAETGGDLTQINGDSLFPALNMLNMKYVILGSRATDAEGKEYSVPVEIENPYANGNAWFIDEVKYVDNADDELAMISHINTRHTAVANKQFESIIGNAKADSTATATLTAYEANELAYDVESKAGGVLVFSEIYYPGWTATVDGNETEIARVNYVLRAIKMEGGKHKVILKFDPQSVHTTDLVAYISLAILALMLVGALVLAFKKKQQE